MKRNDENTRSNGSRDGLCKGLGEGVAFECLMLRLEVEVEKTIEGQF